MTTTAFNAINVRMPFLEWLPLLRLFRRQFLIGQIHTLLTVWRWDDTWASVCNRCLPPSVISRKQSGLWDSEYRIVGHLADALCTLLFYSVLLCVERCRLIAHWAKLVFLLLGERSELGANVAPCGFLNAITMADRLWLRDFNGTEQGDSQKPLLNTARANDRRTVCICIPLKILELPPLCQRKCLGNLCRCVKSHDGRIFASVSDFMHVLYSTTWCPCVNAVLWCYTLLGTSYRIVIWTCSTHHRASLCVGGYIT